LSRPDNKGNALHRVERDLRNDVRASGVLRPTPVLYGCTFAAHALLLFAALAAAGWSDHPLWRGACAIAFAFAMVQIGFVGHDADHGQVAASAAGKTAWGLLCWNLLLGISLEWWRDKHRTHHRETHVVGRDPDLYAVFGDGGTHWPSRHRRLFLWVAVVSARIYFQAASVVSLLRRGLSMRRAMELALIAAHHALLWIAAGAVLGEGAAAFIAVGYLATGLYMGSVFATNHLGCPHASAAGRGRLWQAASTRNIRTGRFGDYLCGGLNYQIEHHLFPHASRFRLHELQPVVRAFCRNNGIPYHETGFLEALREIHQAFAPVPSVRQAR
jgi:fatty acid desaturase